MHKLNRVPSLLLCVVVSALISSGCATTIKYNWQGIASSNTWVTVTTEPPGATGRFASGRTFSTPANLLLPSDEDVAVTLSKDGYEPVEVQLLSRMNLYFVWNFLPLPFPFVGYAIDLEQNAHRTLSPEAIDVVLVPTASATES